MAYTKSPTVSTYSTERVQLTRDINTRVGGLVTKDEDYLNCFIETEKNREAGDSRQFIVKRAGATQLVASVASSTIRGMHYWADQDKLFYCVGQDIIIYTVGSASSSTLSTAFSTSTGDVGFTEFLYDDGSVKMVATDGTTLMTIDSSNTKVVCTDADLPTHLPYPIFLDGYIFVAKAGSADVHNSDLNDPLSWTSGDVISAEMEPDKVVRIAKINNYLAVFGTESIEYFWDAGIDTGSPMQRNDTPVKLNTYLGGFSQIGNNIYYIGRNAFGQPDIYMLNDFKIENLGTPTISRYLNVQTSAFSTWKAGMLACQGHTFYVMNVGSSTYVMDVENKLWYRWGWQGTSSFPISLSYGTSSSSKFYSFFSLNGSSAIYYMNENVYQDSGTNFTSSLVTEASDFDTMNRKTMKRLSIIGDRTTTTGNVLLSWSDDDYKNFSASRTINMDQDLPSTYQLGSFRQRIFKLSFTENLPWRIQRLEVDINKGQS